MLKEFSLSAVLEAKDAKHDRISLHVKHRIYYGSQERIETFRQFLAPPVALRTGESLEPYGRLFNRSRLSVWAPLTIRRSTRGASHASPPPLFSGEYYFRTAAGSEQWLTNLELSVNPTRFLRHQNPVTFLSSRQNLAATDPTFFRAVPIADVAEASLDDEDNFIPNTSEFARLSDGALWARILRTYLTGVLRLIDDDTELAAGGDGVWMQFEEQVSGARFTLRQAEVYFDFLVIGPTPIGLVSSLESPLQSYPLTARDYPVESASSWEAMSRVLTLQVRAGVKVKIYAKTNRRVRFEVTYEMNDVGLRSTATGRNYVRRRQTFGTLSGVERRLDELRGDAANEVNKVLRHIKNRVSLPATPHTALDLLIDFTRALNNRESARILLDTLLYKGSITSLPQYRLALDKLRRAGILEALPGNHRKEHVVTAPYRHPLRMLREHGASPYLDIRHRTRASDPPRPE